MRSVQREYTLSAFNFNRDIILSILSIAISIQSIVSLISFSVEAELLPEELPFDELEPPPEELPPDELEPPPLLLPPPPKLPLPLEKERPLLLEAVIFPLDKSSFVCSALNIISPF